MVLVGAVFSVITAPSTTLEQGSLEDDGSYLVFKYDGTSYAKNGSTGKIDYYGTNDTKVIQYALDNLPTRTWKEKVKLKGNFSTDTHIVVPSYTTIVLDGSITFTNNRADASCGYLVNDTHHVELIGGTIHGNSAGQTHMTFPIMIGYANNVTVRGITVTNSSGFAIYVYSGNDVNILYNQIKYGDEAGIAVEAYDNDSINVKVIGNTVREVGLVGSSNKNGIHYEGHVTTDHETYNGLVSGNTVIGARGCGIYNSVSVAGIISDNIVIDCYVEGIVLIACTEYVINGNTLINNDQGGIGGYVNGIRLDDTGVSPSTVRTIVHNNRIVNHTGYAVLERGTPDYNSIRHNIVYGNGAGVYTVGANSIYSDNLGNDDERLPVNRLLGVTPTFSGLNQNPSDPDNSTDDDWSITTGWGYDNCSGAWEKSYVIWDLGAEYTFQFNYLMGLYGSAGTTYWDLEWKYGGTWYTQTISSTTATSETLLQKGTCVLRADQVRFRFQSNGANDVVFRLYEVQAIELPNVAGV